MMCGINLLDSRLNRAIPPQEVGSEFYSQQQTELIYKALRPHNPHIDPTRLYAYHEYTS